MPTTWGTDWDYFGTADHRRHTLCPCPCIPEEASIITQGLLLILFSLAKQFHLSLAQVLSLQTTILIGRMLLLLILLLTWHPIDLLSLTYSQNPIRVIILISSWLIYLVNSQTHLMLIKLLVLILILGKLKPVFLTPLVALSLTSSIIFYSNVISTSALILCNSIQILQKSTL